MARVATLQDNLRKSNKPITRYAYWLGGFDTTNGSLEQIDILRTGYGRILLLQMPKFVEYLLPEETKKFKHLIEFANVGIDGIGGITVDFGTATGGYNANNIELPTMAKEETTSITIKVHETQDSLIRTYLEFWITGTFDTLTGLNHYHGARDIDKNSSSFEFSQANHTMEALYMSTDPTGEIPNFAVYITNMFPKGVDRSHFNYEPGSHDLVTVSMEFTANVYNSSSINYLASVALKKFSILKNYLNMQIPYDAKDIEDNVSNYYIDAWTDRETGRDLTGSYLATEHVKRYNA